ncbi:MAG: hypothetical protein CMN76_08685 [Spirochaetaceae bacterium]|nr:hypothetical protein [Spirochaetaceae bacterium]|tara:strand:+ start:63787 stop:64179 length:393 start_codon:yes stop_codon:yes gene_type:complete
MPVDQLLPFALGLLSASALYTIAALAGRVVRCRQERQRLNAYARLYGVPPYFLDESICIRKRILDAGKAVMNKAFKWVRLYLGIARVPEICEASTGKRDFHDYSVHKGGTGWPAHFYTYRCWNCGKEFEI